MMLQFMKCLFTLSLKLQEVDEPLQLDMSELCLSDDFPQGNDGEHNWLWEQALSLSHFPFIFVLFYLFYFAPSRFSGGTL